MTTTTTTETRIPYAAFKAASTQCGQEAARFVLNCVRVQIMRDGSAWAIEGCDGRSLIRIESQGAESADFDHEYLIDVAAINGPMKIGKWHDLDIYPADGGLGYTTPVGHEGTVKAEDGTFPNTDAIMPALDSCGGDWEPYGVDPIRLGKLLAAMGYAAGKPDVHHSARVNTTGPKHAIRYTIETPDVRVSGVVMPCILKK